MFSRGLFLQSVRGIHETKEHLLTIGFGVRSSSLIPYWTHLFCKLVEPCIVLLLLPRPPGRPGLESLEAAVRGEGVVEDLETVAGHVHLVHLDSTVQSISQLTLHYLSVPRHSEPDKPLVEGRRVRPRHVQRLVLEDVLVHLVGHVQLLCLLTRYAVKYNGYRHYLGYGLPPLEVAGLLVDGVERLVELPRLPPLHHRHQLALVVG